MQSRCVTSRDTIQPSGAEIHLCSEKGRKKPLCMCGPSRRSPDDRGRAVMMEAGRFAGRVLQRSLASAAAAVFVKDLSVCNSIPYLREHVDLGLYSMPFGASKAALFAQLVLLSARAQDPVGQTLPVCNQL